MSVQKNDTNRNNGKHRNRTAIISTLLYSVVVEVGVVGCVLETKANGQDHFYRETQAGRVRKGLYLDSWTALM